MYQIMIAMFVIQGSYCTNSFRNSIYLASNQARPQDHKEMLAAKLVAIFCILLCCGLPSPKAKSYLVDTANATKTGISFLTFLQQVYICTLYFLMQNQIIDLPT